MLGYNIMKRLLALTVILTTLHCASTKPTLDRTAVLRAERELANALAAMDTTRLAEIWSDDLRFTFPNGSTATKAERLRSIESSRGSGPVLSSDNQSIAVDIYGRTAVAIVVSAWNAGGSSGSQRYRATHVWVQERGAWRLVAAHVSQIKER